MKNTRILMIATSHADLPGNPGRSGIWLEELAATYYMLKQAGAKLVLASPKGGRVPVDPKSESIIVATPPTKQFLKDEEAVSFLRSSAILADINPTGFDLVLLLGGHGALWDFPGNAELRTIITHFIDVGKPLAAISHGVSALPALLKEDGSLFVKGRRMTAFSNEEEKSARLELIVPLMIQDKLVASGAQYSSAANYLPHIVEDGMLITGQNPSSATGVAQALIFMVQQRRYDESRQLA